MTFFTLSNLFHAYGDGNHRKYSNVFGKYQKCLKLFLIHFWIFENFLKIFGKVPKSSKRFGSSLKSFFE